MIGSPDSGCLSGSPAPAARPGSAADRAARTATATLRNACPARAHNLTTTPGWPNRRRAAMYARAAVAAAAYAAAMRDGPTPPGPWLGEADHAIQRAGPDTGDRVGPVGVTCTRSALLGSWRLRGRGRLRPPGRSDRITAPERQARYWEDTALALHGRGRQRAAFQPCWPAEQLLRRRVDTGLGATVTLDLLTADTRTALPGLREFAHRIGAPGSWSGYRRSRYPPRKFGSNVTVAQRYGASPGSRPA